MCMIQFTHQYRHRLTRSHVRSLTHSFAHHIHTHTKSCSHSSSVYTVLVHILIFFIYKHINLHSLISLVHSHALVGFLSHKCMCAPLHVGAAILSVLFISSESNIPFWNLAITSRTLFLYMCVAFDWKARLLCCLFSFFTPFTVYSVRIVRCDAMSLLTPVVSGLIFWMIFYSTNCSSLYIVLNLSHFSFYTKKIVEKNHFFFDMIRNGIWHKHTPLIRIYIDIPVWICVLRTVRSHSVWQLCMHWELWQQLTSFSVLSQSHSHSHSRCCLV